MCIFNNHISSEIRRRTSIVQLVNCFLRILGVSISTYTKKLNKKTAKKKKKQYTCKRKPKMGQQKTKQCKIHKNPNKSKNPTPNSSSVRYTRCRKKNNQSKRLIYFNQQPSQFHDTIIFVLFFGIKCTKSKQTPQNIKHLRRTAFGSVLKQKKNKQKNQII